LFTGIVEEVGAVKATFPDKITIGASVVLDKTAVGDSIAVNGVCLTAVALTSNSFTASVTPETLRRSNLGELKTGDKVNLERPLALGGRLGGHLVEGHVDGTGRVVSMRPEAKATIITVTAPPDLMRYIVEKGFVAVSGMSLTVIERDASSFKVSIVDYTREHTTIKDWKINNTLNIEVDIIAKYVEQLVKPQSGGITADFLKENGFFSPRS
jgi:riboflavin synthase